MELTERQRTVDVLHSSMHAQLAALSAQSCSWTMVRMRVTNIIASSIRFVCPQFLIELFVQIGKLRKFFGEADPLPVHIMTEDAVPRRNSTEAITLRRHFSAFIMVITLSLENIRKPMPAVFGRPPAGAGRSAKTSLITSRNPPPYAKHRMRILTRPIN